MPYSGVVQSYGDARGCGFIACKELIKDTFFGRSTLPVELRECGRIFSLQGKNVVFEIDSSKTGQNNAFVASSVRLKISEGVQAVGTVKRYNPIKGFGFLSCASLDEDPFFAKKDVPLTKQNSHLEGTIASFVVEVTQDGKVRATSLKFKDSAPLPTAASGPAMLGAQEAPAQQQPALQSLLPALGLLAPVLGGGRSLKAAGGLPGTSALAAARALAILAEAAKVGSGARTAAGTVALGGTSASGSARPGTKAQHMACERPVSARGSGPSEGQGMSGTVVSFHTDRGYGFISADGIEGDLYFRGDDCTGGPFEPGTRVAFNFRAMPDGKNQARSVVRGMVDGENYEGTVASYSGRNGYGFIALPEHPDGVYFNKATLPAHLQETEDLRGWQVVFLAHLQANGKARAGRLEFPAWPAKEETPAEQAEQQESPQAYEESEDQEAYGWQGEPDGEADEAPPAYEGGGEGPDPVEETEQPPAAELPLPQVRPPMPGRVLQLTSKPARVVNDVWQWKSQWPRKEPAAEQSRKRPLSGITLPLQPIARPAFLPKRVRSQPVDW